MKRFVALLGLTLIISGCGLLGGGPGGVVKDFYRYVEKGELTKAYDLISVQGKLLVSNSQNLAPMTEAIKKKKGITDIKILKEDVTGEIASVDLDLTYGDGSKETVNNKLVKEDGKWRINFKK